MFILQILYKLRQIFPRHKFLGSVVTINGNIQNEINERIKKASQFYHLVKGLLRNKDTLKIYFRRILLFGAETWTATKKRGEQNPSHANEIFEINFKQSKER